MIPLAVLRGDARDAAIRDVSIYNAAPAAIMTACRSEYGLSRLGFGARPLENDVAHYAASEGATGIRYARLAVPENRFAFSSTEAPAAIRLNAFHITW